MNIETSRLSPKDPSDRLLDAKDDFRRLFLDDDVAFAVLREKLFDSDIDKADFPDFGIEPTLERDETAQSKIGIRIDQSRSLSDDELTATVAAYEYLNLGGLDRETGKFRVSPELKGLLKSAGFEESDALAVTQAWQNGFQAIVAKMGNEASIDPYSNVVELTDVIERTVHFD
jgi:hypothetical protein